MLHILGGAEMLQEMNKFTIIEIMVILGYSCNIYITSN